MIGYQRKRKNPYLLPHSLYMRIIYAVRDYERMREAVDNDEIPRMDIADELKDIVRTSLTGRVHTSVVDGIIEKVVGNLLSSGLITLPDIADVSAIEEALEKIPEFYREPICRNIISGEQYPPGASKITFCRYKQMFIYYVAKFLRRI